MVTIEGRGGISRVTLVECTGYVEATYERLTSGGEWLLLRRTEMRASWDRALELAAKIVDA